MNPVPLLAALTIAFSLAPLTRADEAAPKPDAKPDRERIQGTWKAADGGLVLQFEGEQVFDLKGGRRQDPATFRLDPDKAPKQIDLTPTEGADKGKTILGIYELDGDTLRICLGGQEKRPAEFKADGDLILLAFRREKK